MSRRPAPEQQARNQRVDRIVELFTSGYSQDYVCEQGVAGGWTRDDVLIVVRQRGWPLDGSGRLPLRMRPQRQPARATRTARGARGPKTPTEGTPPGTVRAGDAGTAPDSPETGHGNAGPDAQPQVSPSRSRHLEENGEPGASDAPAGLPSPVPTAVEIRARVDAMAPRVTEAGLINTQHVAMEQTLRHRHALPSYVPELDGPGKFRPTVTELPTCCAAGREVYPGACPDHGVQVPADLLADEELSVDYSVADAGEVVHPGPPARQQVDLIAVGLEHPHPAVRAKAQLVVKAADALISALARHRDG